MAASRSTGAAGDPRLTDADLAQWPADVVAHLHAEYDRVESELGVAPGTDFLSGDLLARLQTRLAAVLPGIPNLDPAPPGGPVQPAPVAVQAVLRRPVCSASTSTAACPC